MDSEMATRIQSLLTNGRPRRAGRAPTVAPVPSPAQQLEAYGGVAVVELARRIYKLRRSRDASFGADLFSEPAWDLLLHLFVADAEGRTVSVSSACEGAGAPATTALRKLTQLEEGGWIVREVDPADARRSYVRLSSRATKKMRSLLKALCSKKPGPVA
jgi:DNA-binding MarR family transcriptional regulator